MSGSEFCWEDRSTRTGKGGNCSSKTIPSAILSINGTPGTSTRFPNRRNAISMVTTAGSSRHDGTTGESVVINLPKTSTKPETTFEWKIPKWNNTIERNRARSYFQAYAAACALHFLEQGLDEVRAGRTKTWEP